MISPYSNQTARPLEAASRQSFQSQYRPATPIQAAPAQQPQFAPPPMGGQQAAYRQQGSPSGPMGAYAARPAPGVRQAPPPAVVRPQSALKNNMGEYRPPPMQPQAAPRPPQVAGPLRSARAPRTNPMANSPGGMGTYEWHHG